MSVPVTWHDVPSSCHLLLDHNWKDSWQMHVTAQPKLRQNAKDSHQSVSIKSKTDYDF